MIICTLECVRTMELENYLEEQGIKFTIQNPTILKLQIDKKLVPIIRSFARNISITDEVEVYR